MKKLLLALGLLGLSAIAAHAASQAATVVASCGTPPVTYTAGQSFPVTQDTTGKLCSASSFTPSGTQNVNLIQVGGIPVAAGSAVSAASIPVVIASDQAAVAVKQATAANLNAAVVGVGTAGAASGGILTVQGVASMTKLLVTPDSVALPANQSVNAAQINGVTPFMGNGVTGTGSLRVTIASDNTANSNPFLVTGSGTAGSAAAGVVTVQGVASMTPVQAALTPQTTGGLSVYAVEPGASDNHVVIKNGAGQVYGINTFSKNAAAQFMRLYNVGTGFNGCNSATGLIWEGIIPGATTGAGFVVEYPNGIAFGTGISICVTGAYGQTDTTAATASVMAVNIMYK